MLTVLAFPTPPKNARDHTLDALAILGALYLLLLCACMLGYAGELRAMSSENQRFVFLAGTAPLLVLMLAMSVLLYVDTAIKHGTASGFRALFGFLAVVNIGTAFVVAQIWLS